MANTLAVCLLASILCCAGLSYARQVPAYCAKGPEIWCKSIRKASECGAVQHCIGTVWEKQVTKTTVNNAYSKIIVFFQEMKDVKDLINNEYLAKRISAACRLLPDIRVSATCRSNTIGLEEYIAHLLASKTSPETMCRLIEVCTEDKKEEPIAKPAKDDEESALVPTTNRKHSMPVLLGAEKCTWGPSYWCNNFSTGKECKAMHHCLTRVWPNTKFPVDNDDICKICKDMVTQARDQLMSNETQTELKEVFDGSCQLIPIKIVAKECMKLADDFVPELVETLSSQMDPNAVCSVAGLCNSARIDELLLDYNTHVQHYKNCNGCKSTVSLIRNNFKASSYDDFLVSLLQICRKMDSMSDSCSMLVFKYYENIRASIEQDLKPHGLCHLSGECANLYSHSHDQYIFPADFEEIEMKNDVPCEFCEQLVTHLRDMLIANTTETEFYKVLRGLCKQSGKFESECLSLAEQYYAFIYKYLTNDLQGGKICSFMGICNTTDTLAYEPVAPLLVSKQAVRIIPPSSSTHNIPTAETTIPVQSSVISESTPVHNVQVEALSPSVAALPIERMFLSVPQSKTACSFCQYLLHYLQVELSDVKNEDYIRNSVMGACEKLPKVINAECKQFITEYGPAVIALLVQEIDPSTVCPSIRVCPSAKDQVVVTTTESTSQSNCPLCLFAVEQLETVLKNNRTTESIHKALDGLCNHLSTKLQKPCIQFVDTYSNALVELLLADLNAQEICVYLKICKDQPANVGPLHGTATTSTAANIRPDFYMSMDKFMETPTKQADFNNVKKASHPTITTHMEVGGDIETNEIHDNTINGRPIKQVSQKTVCVVCEFVMKEIDDQIKDKHNDDQIKRVVHGVCKRMPKSVRSDCDQFVEKYADLIISLLAQELDPSQVCEELKLCPPTRKTINSAKAEDILNCAVCETVVMSVKKVLKNDAVDRNIVHIIEKSCALLPSKYSDRCRTMMEIYGDSVIHLVEQYGSKQVCQKIGLCSDFNAAIVDLYQKTHKHESPMPRK